MSEEMLKLYKELNTNEKRNEFSKLIMKLDQLIDELITEELEHINFKKIKNYNFKNSENITEDEMLTFFYDDLWNIKSKILAILTMKYGEEKNE